MAAFPTLSVLPSDIREVPIDRTIRSEYEGGYEHTRPRHTRDRKQWQIVYNQLNSNDKSLMDTFLGTTVRGGADSFSWAHPISSTVYTVRFQTLPYMQLLLNNDDDQYYETSFELKEL